MEEVILCKKLTFKDLNFLFIYKVSRKNVSTYQRVVTP